MDTEREKKTDFIFILVDGNITCDVTKSIGFFSGFKLNEYKLLSRTHTHTHTPTHNNSQSITM